MTTTTLADAIAKLKAIEIIGPAWTDSHVVQLDDYRDGESIATILNAVASGALIPATDAKLAVAEALRMAADQVRCGCNGATGCMDTANCAIEDVDAILALIPDAALARVQALRAERDDWEKTAGDFCRRAVIAEAKLAALADAAIDAEMDLGAWASFKEPLERDGYDVGHTEAVRDRLVAALTAAKGG